MHLFVEFFVLYYKLKSKLKKNCWDKIFASNLIEQYGTIDFIHDHDSRPMFRTCEKEKGKVVFQMVRKHNLLFKKIS